MRQRSWSLEKLLLGALAGRADSDIQKATRGLLNFVYYAQYEVHSEDTLAQMQRALEMFHRHKRGFVKAEIREHFNIPKVHSLIHYLDGIRQLGCLDGVNTETLERLHIDYAKKAYRASSRREYISQMTTWLQRQEAIERRDSYLSWVEGRLEEELVQSAADEFEEDEEDEAADADADEDEGEGEDAGDGDEAEEGCGKAGQQNCADEDFGALLRLLHSNVSHAFQLPLTPAARGVTVERLTSAYGTADFLVELNEYLSPGRHPNDLPRAMETIRVEVYHAISVLLPANIHISNEKRLHKVRASPAVPRIRDCHAIPRHFDCALFMQDEDCYRLEGGLQGESELP